MRLDDTQQGARTGVTTVELLRHAHAHARGSWDEGPDHARPLDAGGRRQAERLVASLQGPEAPAAIVTSPFARCVQTVEPLAAATGVAVTHADGLAEAPAGIPTDQGTPWVGAAWLGGRAAAVLDALVEEHGDGRVVVCTHGDVCAALLSLLAGRDGLDLTDVHVDKGAWVSLTFEGGRCTGWARHDAPPKSKGG